MIVCPPLVHSPLITTALRSIGNGEEEKEQEEVGPGHYRSCVASSKHTSSKTEIKGGKTKQPQPKNTTSGTSHANRHIGEQ